ncbi:MAG: 3-keto-disaccharide hydrolase [Verrucomicrobiaceae bacterium]
MKHLLILPLLLSQLTAAEKTPHPTWTDPAKATREAPSFLIQGEYHAKDAPLAAQVVALGGANFEVYLLESGLPGLGWNRTKARHHLLGTLADGLVTFPPNHNHSAQIEEGKITILRDGDENPIILPRITRTSPTLGAKPPKGSTILFDGTSVEHWTNGKMIDGLLQATGTTSKPTFKSYQLHLEFRTPYKPFARGQGRGNSGVYFGARWETQILDSFGLDGKMNECGGIYSIAAPRLNACLPPLTWQTYDVDFTAAQFNPDGTRSTWPKMTVKLNGIIVHQDRELNKDFTGSAPSNTPLKDEPLPVFLQNHGNPVVFRNIWVLPK